MIEAIQQRINKILLEVCQRSYPDMQFRLVNGSLVVELEEQANIDSLTLVAKDKQIELLKARDVANEKMVKLIEKKWYENEYIWLGIGFILGKL